jgi:hypothetical protein
MNYLAVGITSTGWALGCGNYHSFVATALTPPKINGSCGYADGHKFASLPSSGSAFCSKGTLTNESWDGDDEYEWTCQGSGGGSNESCSMEVDGGGSCGNDLDCDDGEKCRASRCVEVVTCAGGVMCRNGTCPTNGACVPNDDFFSLQLKPSLVEHSTDTCLAAWTFDDMQTNDQAVVCTITGTGGFKYTATSTESGEKAVPIGNYTLTCKLSGITQTESASCRQIPRFQEF